MSIFDDTASGFQPIDAILGPVMGTFSAFSRGRQDRKQKAEQEAQQNEMFSLLQQGMQTGRQQAENIYGRSTSEMSGDIADIRKRRRELMEGPSRAASEVRAKGQQQTRQAAERGASEQMQRQMQLNTARAAGAQEEASYMNNLQNYQNLVGSEASTRLAMEPLFGNLYLSSQYQAPPQMAGQGIIGGLLSGLGL